jgi:hypothetical protein
MKAAMVIILKIEIPSNPDQKTEDRFRGQKTEDRGQKTDHNETF